MQHVESENTILTSKLARTAWGIESRLDELELQMGALNVVAGSSPSSMDPEDPEAEECERNRESII